MIKLEQKTLDKIVNIINYFVSNAKLNISITEAIEINKQLQEIQKELELVKENKNGSETQN